MAKEDDKEKWEKEWEEKWGKKWDKKKWRGPYRGGFGGGFYFLVFIGTAVYYVQQSVGFWPGVLGVLKACVWPALLGYKVFTLLGM